MNGGKYNLVTALACLDMTDFTHFEEDGGGLKDDDERRYDNKKGCEDEEGVNFVWSVEFVCGRLCQLRSPYFFAVYSVVCVVSTPEIVASQLANQNTSPEQNYISNINTRSDLRLVALVEQQFTSKQSELEEIVASSPCATTKRILQYIPNCGHKVTRTALKCIGVRHISLEKTLLVVGRNSSEDRPFRS